MKSFPLRSVRHVGLIVSLLLVASGCAMGNSAADVRSLAVSSVPARVYSATLDEGREAALYALRESGIEIIEQQPDADGGWYCIGEIGYSWRSNGQFLRIVTRPDPASQEPRVEVFYNSRKRFDMNVTEDLLGIKEKLLSLMDLYIESL